MQKFRVGIVGAGFIGLAHLEALRRLGNVEVVALCSRSADAQLACTTGVPLIYTDYRQMIEQAKPDVVHICTPNDTHYEIAKYALERNAHVLCEKPFVMELQEAETLLRLAERKGLHGGINFHHRFYPMVCSAREEVKAGKLGRVLSVHGSYLQDWLLWETDYSWRLNRFASGKTRAVADIGSHWMDTAEYITGQRIQSVMACFSTVYPTRRKPQGRVQSFLSENGTEYEKIPVDTEDCAAILFKMENGAIGSLMLSQTFAGKKNELSIQVAGTKASVAWASDRPEEMMVGRRERANELYVKDPSYASGDVESLIGYPGGHVEGFPDAFKNCFQSFYTSLVEEVGGSYATFQDGLRSMKLCEAIYRSAMKNCPLEVE